MSLILPQRGKLSGSVPPVLTYIGENLSTSNVDSYSFTSEPIGTAAADRLVVVVALTNVCASFSSITIGGVSATIHEQLADSGTSPCQAIASLLVTTGTTATIVVNLSDSGGHMAIGVYNITGLNSTTPEDSGQDGLTTGTSVSDTLVVSKDACIIAAGGQYSGNPPISWTGVTEDFEEAFSGESGTSAWASTQVTSGGSVPVTMTTLGSGVNGVVMAAWR